MILLLPKSVSPVAVNPFNTGGVSVKTPLVLLYVKDPLPEGAGGLGSAEKSVNAIPLLSALQT